MGGIVDERHSLLGEGGKSVVTITSTLGQSNTRIAGTGAIVSDDGSTMWLTVDAGHGDGAAAS